MLNNPLLCMKRLCASHTFVFAPSPADFQYASSASFDAFFCAASFAVALRSLQIIGANYV
jgi:hypothetical protein